MPFRDNVINSVFFSESEWLPPRISWLKDSDVGFLEEGARMSIRVQFYIHLHSSQQEEPLLSTILATGEGRLAWIRQLSASWHHNLRGNFRQAWLQLCHGVHIRGG